VDRVRLAALLAATALVAAGCSDNDPEPRIDPTPSTSPTESASPWPSSAETSDPPGTTDPEDAVRAWVTARNETIQNGNATGVRSLSTGDCTTCRDLIDPIEAVYTNGGHMDTSGWHIAALNLAQESSADAEVVVGLVYAAGETVPSAGADPIQYELERHIAKFRLRNHSDGWKVREVVYVS
jgi:hypothetical protein